MIRVENTPNLTGVKISGDYIDLDELVQAFYIICASDYESKHTRYNDMSTRVLGLCYDIRHAFQGDREISLVENGMDEGKMKWHSIKAPRNNVYYSCNCLYPEMFYIMIALNSLIELRIRILTKKRYVFTEAFDKNVIWDKSIAQMRILQAAFAECLKETVSEGTFSRLLNSLNSKYSNIEMLTHQYIDHLNIRYVSMTKEKRLKNLGSFARRIANFEYDDEHEKISMTVRDAAKLFDCMPGEIKIKGLDYPEEIEW
jgi:hypothetical protein